MRIFRTNKEITKLTTYLYIEIMKSTAILFLYTSMINPNIENNENL